MSIFRLPCAAAPVLLLVALAPCSAAAQQADHTDHPGDFTLSPVPAAAPLPPADGATPAPKSVLRSGDVVSCVIDKSCTEETIHGRRYLVLQTPEAAVKLSITPDSRYNHAFVTIENHASWQLKVNPAEFRIEVSEPKFKRLSWLDPHAVKPYKFKSEPLPKPSELGSGTTLQNPNFSGHVAGVPFLKATTLAPSASTSGEVFFETSKNMGGMSLYVPLGGITYEFPLTPPTHSAPPPGAAPVVQVAVPARTAPPQE
jgi:hypothetical protein